MTRPVRRSVVVVLLIGCLAGCGSTSSSGGSANGEAMRQLDRIGAAVPPGASRIAARVYAPQWLPVCPSDPMNSRAGWTVGRVDVTFSDPDPGALIASGISSLLFAQGWTRHDVVIGRGQGPVAHWSRRIGAAHAQAFAFHGPGQPTDWVLTATWRPVGPPAIAGSCA